MQRKTNAISKTQEKEWERGNKTYSGRRSAGGVSQRGPLPVHGSSLNEVSAASRLLDYLPLNGLHGAPYWHKASHILQDWRQVWFQQQLLAVTISKPKLQTNKSQRSKIRRHKIEGQKSKSVKERIVSTAVCTIGLIIARILKWYMVPVLWWSGSMCQKPGYTWCPGHIPDIAWKGNHFTMLISFSQIGQRYQTCK
jgi:hypothetical protein